MFKVLYEDKIGFVELEEFHGSELFISSVSGVSHDNNKGASIAKLLEWGHLSPLEFAGITFRVKCPIFVARQLMRHRTGHYMELSLRYCDSKLEYYIPTGLTDEQRNFVNDAFLQCSKVYEDLKQAGVPKEKARAILPVGLYTTVMMQFDLRNLKHLLELRTDSHAQEETQWYANAMLALVKEIFPTVGASI